MLLPAFDIPSPTHVFTPYWMPTQHSSHLKDLFFQLHPIPTIPDSMSAKIRPPQSTFNTGPSNARNQRHLCNASTLCHYQTKPILLSNFHPTLAILASMSAKIWELSSHCLYPTPSLQCPHPVPTTQYPHSVSLPNWKLHITFILHVMKRSTSIL